MTLILAYFNDREKGLRITRIFEHLFRQKMNTNYGNN